MDKTHEHIYAAIKAITELGIRVDAHGLETLGEDEAMRLARFSVASHVLRGAAEAFLGIGIPEDRVRAAFMATAGLHPGCVAEVAEAAKGGWDEAVWPLQVLKEHWRFPEKK